MKRILILSEFPLMVCNKNNAGTYCLNGYSMELRFNNGTTERKSFYFYPKVNGTFVLNGSDYVPAD